MPKVTLNGTSGLVAYKADNSTVEVAYTPTELTNIKPSVFISASPFIIAGGLRIDANSNPSILQFPDGTTSSLLNRGATYISSSTESHSAGDRTHTMPSGIQAGDLLIMTQATAVRTADGYGPSVSGIAGNGFTTVGSTSEGVAYWYWKPGGSAYDISVMYCSYKIAAGNESGTNITNFASVNQSVGSQRGHRTLYVYRAGFTVGSVSVATSNVDTGNNASSSFSSHQHTNTSVGSSVGATVGVVQYASGNGSQSATISGGATSFDATSSNGNGYALSTIFTGAFNSKAPTPTITTTGPTTTSGDALATTIFSLDP